MAQQDLARARLLVEEAVVRSRARHYLYNRAYGLPLLGLIVLWQGETALASALFKECLQFQQQLFYWSFMALSSGSLGAIAWRQGDVAQTSALLEQCRARDKELSKPSTVATYILGLAAAVAAQGEPRRAARLLGCWRRCARRPRRWCHFPARKRASSHRQPYARSWEKRRMQPRWQKGD